MEICRFICIPRGIQNKKLFNEDEFYYLQAI